VAARVLFTIDQYVVLPTEEAYAALCDWENHVRRIHRMNAQERADDALHVTLKETGPLLFGSSTLSARPFNQTSCVVRWSEDVHARVLPGILSGPLTLATKFFVRRALRRLPRR
jgi:hypothetical protein